MSVDGVWTAEAYGAFGWENRGIFLLENGRTLGGDNRMFCSGHYRMSGDEFQADWIVHYFGPPRTVFGEAKEEIALEVRGRVEDNVIEAILRRPERPKFELRYRLTRRMDLPQA